MGVWCYARRLCRCRWCREGLGMVKIWSAVAVLGAELVVLVWRVGVHAWDALVPAVVR